MVTFSAAVALIVLVLTGLAEWRHARRTARLARLAFGPAGRARAWTRAVPVVRAVAFAGLAWALAVLYQLEPKAQKAREAAPNQQRHVVLVLDVSPSMKLADAGDDGKESRAKRAATLMYSFFRRVPMELVKLTVIATYTGAKPVVVDTKDVNVVRNILDGLPLSNAFNAGRTDIFSGIREAARIAHPWERDSTTLVILTDGDSVPPQGMPKLPPSVAEVVVVGVGDSRKGSFIDGYQSRQQSASLQQIAVRLKGNYFDGNARQLPTDLLRRMTSVPEPGLFEKLTLREYALGVLGLTALVLALLPWLLQRWGAGFPLRMAAARPVQASRAHAGYALSPD